MFPAPLVRRKKETSGVGWGISTSKLRKGRGAAEETKNKMRRPKNPLESGEEAPRSLNLGGVGKSSIGGLQSSA